MGLRVGEALAAASRKDARMVLKVFIFEIVSETLELVRRLSRVEQNLWSIYANCERLCDPMSRQTIISDRANKWDRGDFIVNVYVFTMPFTHHYAHSLDHISQNFSYLDPSFSGPLLRDILKLTAVFVGLTSKAREL